MALTETKVAWEVQDLRKMGEDMLLDLGFEDVSSEVQQDIHSFDYIIRWEYYNDGEPSFAMARTNDFILKCSSIDTRIGLISSLRNRVIEKLEDY